MSTVQKDLKTSSCITKLNKPILTKDNMPYDASLVFNAGVAKYKGKYIMVFRNDYGVNKAEFESGKRGFKTSVGIASSENGIDNWVVSSEVLVDSADMDGEISRLYDPRITVIDDVPYLCLAKDTKHGVCGCIGKLNEKLDGIEIISSSVPDNRNMVLFPEKINGMYVRLERPFPVYSRWGQDRFDIWISKSPDLKYWGECELLLGVEDVPFANDKIGPAAPPVKTEKGWLTTFHAVDIDENRGKNGWEDKWKKRYTAGIMLLDLNDPTKVVGMSKEPLIVADLPFEQENGFRQDVIFPGGMIKEDDGTVKIYYGASDTVECLATAKISDLLDLCTSEK